MLINWDAFRTTIIWSHFIYWYFRRKFQRDVLAGGILELFCLLVCWLVFRLNPNIWCIFLFRDPCCTNLYLTVHLVSWINLFHLSNFLFRLISTFPTNMNPRSAIQIYTQDVRQPDSLDIWLIIWQTFSFLLRRGICPIFLKYGNYPFYLRDSDTWLQTPVYTQFIVFHLCLNCVSACICAIKNSTSFL